MTYEIHPAADIFPMLDGSELRELADDIRQHGQREPIALLGGVIIDGRNRLRACELAGVEPATVELPSDTDPVAYVVSANLHRRHLNTSQRAMCAARLANLGHGGDRKSEEIKTQICASIDDAAERLNVSPRSVDSARQLIQHGSTQLVAAVDRGDVAVSRAADIARNHVPERQIDALTAPSCEHEWESDGSGERFCISCRADHPDNPPRQRRTVDWSKEALSSLGAVYRLIPKGIIRDQAKPHIEELRRLIEMTKKPREGE